MWAEVLSAGGETAGNMAAETETLDIVIDIY